MIMSMCQNGWCFKHAVPANMFSAEGNSCGGAFQLHRGKGDQCTDPRHYKVMGRLFKATSRLHTCLDTSVAKRFWCQSRSDHT